MMNTHGIYLALLEGRFLFDFLHERDLTTGRINKYKTILLPNIALLSDGECAALQCFAQAGGSIMASFETRLYNEKNERRAEFGVAGTFGIHAAKERKIRVGNAFIGRIERRHPILDSFTGTDWLPGAQWLQLIAPVENPVMTVIPPYVNYPPELAYPPVVKADVPDFMAKETGGSRLVYFAGDIERTSWQSGNTNPSMLLCNAVSGVSMGKSPATIEGQGLIETFAWETEAGFALHILNYTNPGAFKGWIRDYYPIGEQRVKIAIPGGRQASRVELLHVGRDVPLKQSDGAVEFVIPGITDYEIAAMYSK